MSKYCSLALWLLILMILISCDLYRACSSSQTVGNVGEAIIHNLGKYYCQSKLKTCFDSLLLFSIWNEGNHEEK